MPIKLPTDNITYIPKYMVDEILGDGLFKEETEDKDEEEDEDD